MSRTATGIWLVVASGLTFSLSGPFAKSLMDVGWSPGATVLVRLASAAVLLVVIAATVDLRGLRAVHRHARTVTLYGVLALATVQTAFFMSIEHLSVGVTLMIQFLAPIVVIGWDWLVRRRRPSPLTLAGAALALIGAALVIDVFGAGQSSATGLFWAGLSMIGNACFFLVSERAGDTMSPVVLLAGGMTVAAASIGLLVGVGAMAMTTTASATEISGHRVVWPVTLVLLIVLSTVAPYLFGVAGGARIGSTLMSLVLLCEVAFGVVFAWLMVGQSISVSQMIGGGLIVVGIALARLGGAGLPTPEEPPARDDLLAAPRSPR